ncbi:gliding motility protein GldN [Draconibacterium sp.]|nr:gliding motility protein GldN [Draconibacterium sp.]
MKKFIVYLGVVVFMLTLAGKQTKAQIVNGAFKRNDIYQKKPMPLPMVRESDVFWSKKVWRIIDLREKMNQSLYYPEVESDGRLNLISLLLKGIESGQITPYDPKVGDDFQIPMSFAQVKEYFGAETKMIEKVDFDTGERTTVKVEGEMRTNSVMQYMIKEEWYFDKQTSTLNVRIIGICPIREFVREGDASGEIQREQLFWVYYPESRPLLATNLVLNQFNEARQMSFDDLFIKRFFNSYIVQESNVYDRNITSYLGGIEAMLESKRIESKIFDFEQDLWEY